MTMTPPAISSDALRRANAARGVMFDIDGCLMLSDGPSGDGGRVLPGAAETLKWFRRRGTPFLAFTNGSAKPPRLIAADLRAKGLDLRDDEVFTPAVVAARVLTREHPGQTILAFGGAGLTEPLAESGVRMADVDRAIAEGPRDVGAVVIGWDDDFGRAKLQIAAEAILAGAPLYCTSAAPAFASHQRLNVGVSGFIAAGLQYVTRTPYRVLGKPSMDAAQAIAERLGTVPADLLIVGDDLVLECSMARAANATGVLVTTGMVTRKMAREAPESQAPDVILDRLDDLVGLLGAFDAANH